MDPAPFLERQRQAMQSSAWCAALIKIALGAALTWIGVAQVAAHAPLWAGHLGIIGWVLMLHCGAFHLLALVWRRAGVAVDPIMDSPLMAASLADFWGRRWNRAFHDLVHAGCYAPLARRWGASAAIGATFLLSGVIHDLVISLPARGGLGLPTAYFAMQGVGMFVERRLRRAWRRPFALILVIAPAPLLFHPPFIERVMAPFLAATGALP